MAERSTDDVKTLASCPFCGGPPVPIATRLLHPHGAVTGADLEVPSGTFVKAVVFCHECGAEGEDAVGSCCLQEEIDILLAAACDNWNRRDARHAELYQAAEVEGLNVWPRAAT